jgi:hypothetical protein
VCLICKDSVSVFKECNIKWYYDARREEKYDVFQCQVRTDKSKSLQRPLSDQQNVFMSLVNENLAAVRTSFYVTKQIARRSQWPCGLRRGSWPVGCWDRGFESRLRHGCLSASFCVVLYCVVEALRRADHSFKES